MGNYAELASNLVMDRLRPAHLLPEVSRKIASDACLPVSHKKVAQTAQKTDKAFQDIFETP